MDEAADRIEELEGALAACSDAYNALEFENKRLRKALQGITECHVSDGFHMRNIANKALEQNDEP